jgi:hypothetical protein
MPRVGVSERGTNSGWRNGLFGLDGEHGSTPDRVKV